tara:strand:+ start:1255 stop:1539 length:285 start_codon:yes stop_codon:yes gene_type:complete
MVVVNMEVVELTLPVELVALVVVEPVMVGQLDPHLETHKELRVEQDHPHLDHLHMVLEEVVALEGLVMQAPDQLVVMVVLVFKFHLRLEILFQP